MATVTVTLSPKDYDLLCHRSERSGRRPEELSREIIERALRERAPEMSTARAVLEAAGLVHPLGHDLRSMIIADVSLDEVRASLSTPDGPTLSEILLEQRGPKD